MNRGYLGRAIFTLIIVLGSLFVLYPTYQWLSVPADYRLYHKTEKLANLEEQMEASDLTEEAKADILKDIIKEKAWIKKITGKAIQFGLDLQGGGHIIIQVHGVVESETEEQSGKDLVAQTLQVLQNRIDGLGVREPLVVRLPNNRIMIECPGADPGDLKEIIQKTALLSFHLEMKDQDFVAELQGIDKDMNLGLLATDGKIKPTYFNQQFTGFQVAEADVAEVSDILFRPEVAARFSRQHTMFFSTKEKDNSGFEYRTLHGVKKKKELGGDLIKEAVAYRDPGSGEAEVSIAFDNMGRKLFSNVTGNHVGENLAIILDGYVVSHPVIREAIRMGRASISGGNMAFDDARKLSIALNAGALPAAIEIVEDRSVSPTLGEDSVTAGKNAIMWGFILVIIFMIIYYAVAGFVADIALLLNLVILLAALAMAHATLTLPGIAGVVLLIGMAVDANVLIFERIREEIGRQVEKKSVSTILDKGFGQAFSTIFDANITTLITACVLMTFGTGPIKGFAVTLIFGIIISMFTALFVSRLILDFLYVRPHKSDLSMGKLHFLSNVSTDIFLAKKKVWAAISGTVIVIGLVLMATIGLERGIDFTGGTMVNLTIENIEIKDVRAKLKTIGFESAVVQQDQTDKTHFSIKVAGNQKGKLDVVQGMIEKALSDNMLQGFEKTFPESTTEIEEESGKTFAVVRTKSRIDRNELDKAFADSGFKGTMIREARDDKSLFLIGLNTRDLLVQHLGIDDKDVMSTDEVGPAIGKELVGQAIMSVVYACLFIIVYIWVRFQFSFGLAAVVALVHDVLITLTAFVIFRHELSIPVIAALLTIIGYSLNDTIVVFDRIRENLKSGRGRMDEVINRSICQSLSRTVITSLTTLSVVLILMIFGGPVIYDFAFALFIGIIVGTYSSVCVASPFLIFWQEFWQKRAEKNNPAAARSRGKSRA
jgi:SecD/SecF fusion protein